MNTDNIRAEDHTIALIAARLLCSQSGSAAYELLRHSGSIDRVVVVATEIFHAAIAWRKELETE